MSRLTVVHEVEMSIAWSVLILAYAPDIKAKVQSIIRLFDIYAGIPGCSGVIWHESIPVIF
jgi:hypothetical protein